MLDKRRNGDQPFCASSRPKETVTLTGNSDIKGLTVHHIQLKTEPMRSEYFSRKISIFPAKGDHVKRKVVFQHFPSIIFQGLVLVLGWVKHVFFFWSISRKGTRASGPQQPISGPSSRTLWVSGIFTISTGAEFLNHQFS